MSNLKNHYDILVVGGGPAGSIASYMLSSAGFRVLLIDAQTTRSRKVCGEFLCFEGVNILRRIGLLHVVKSNGFHKGLGAKIVTNGGVIVTGLFPQKSKGIPGGYCMDRQVFDSALLEEAAEHGTELLLGERITGLNKLTDGWELETLSGIKITGDMLIGADGIRSTVARLLGLTKSQASKRVALRCFLPTRYQNQRLIEMHLLTEGNYIGIDVVADNFVNFSMVVDQEELKKYGGPEGLIRHYYTTYPALRENMILPDVMPKIEAIAPVTHQVTSCISKHTVLIGDAGGFIEPLTGEGITIALWTASALARHLIRYRTQWHKRQEALIAYSREKSRHYFQKKVFTHALHWFIRQEKACDFLCAILKHKPKSVEAFMGIINNTYQPIPGITRLLSGYLSRQNKHAQGIPEISHDKNRNVTLYPVASELAAAKFVADVTQDECQPARGA